VSKARILWKVQRSRGCLCILPSVSQWADPYSLPGPPRQLFAALPLRAVGPRKFMKMPSNREGRCESLRHLFSALLPLAVAHFRASSAYFLGFLPLLEGEVCPERSEGVGPTCVFISWRRPGRRNCRFSIVDCRLTIPGRGPEPGSPIPSPDPLPTYDLGTPYLRRTKFAKSQDDD
jgi:hypothetical protein